MNYELANERAEVLRLLASDLKIEDIQIKIVYFLMKLYGRSGYVNRSSHRY